MAKFDYDSIFNLTNYLQSNGWSSLAGILNGFLDYNELEIVSSNLIRNLQEKIKELERERDELKEALENK